MTDARRCHVAQRINDEGKRMYISIHIHVLLHDDEKRRAARGIDSHITERQIRLEAISPLLLMFLYIHIGK